jgi:diguanylate cyclase (GGDEF)-like protein
MNQQLLIIDDDRAVHQLVSAHLHNAHAQCLSAFDGTDGLRKAFDCQPAAILLDMDMPVMNGIEVCRRLKSEPQTRDIPIVFLTADGRTSSKVQGIEFGAVDYVTKPFEPSELLARVRSAFRMAASINAVHRQPGIDELTGIWNRAYLIKQIEPMAAAANRSMRMLSCCLISIDRFGELSEKMGQPSGADLIRDAAEAISATVRLEDVVCRFDTQTIAVLGLASDSGTLRVLAERLRCCVTEIGLRAFIDPEVVTCSIGAVISRYCAGPMIISAAERALEDAQLEGNRVVFLNSDMVGAVASRTAFN